MNKNKKSKITNKREIKLAQEMRENLKKRKVQLKARRQSKR